MSQSPTETTDVATQIATRRPPAGPVQLASNFQPITDDAAWALAEKIKNSQIIPKDFQGKPENVFIAILMGREVGLQPIQSVQNIMVVNGRPSMWGDALPALVYASNKCQKFEESFDEKTNTAICVVRRVGDTADHVQKFSWADALKAKYNEKSGPWQTNPRRMMQMRARAFALRDKFADVLKGLGMVEEAQDYEIIDNGTTQPQLKMPQEIVDVQEKTAAFAAQESAPAAQNGATETPTAAAAEDPKIAAAKAKFLSVHKVDPRTIDSYMAWNKLKTTGEIYPRLKSLWIDIEKGTTTVAAEFDRFRAAGGETPPADEGDMFA